MKKNVDYITRFSKIALNPYFPKRVFVSESALAYPRTHLMIRKIKKLNRKVQIIKILNNTPSRPKLKDKALYNYLKETIVICTRSANYMEIFASPGKVSENLGVMGKIHYHCPLQCTFCYLDISGQGTPWSRVYVDLENFYDQALKERLTYKLVLTLWSALSFYQKTPLDKVPEKFKEICDKIIRKNVLLKRNGITNDKEAIRFVKKNLGGFFHLMGIPITNKQTAELNKSIPTYYEKNSQYPLSINISEYSETLGLDHITNIMDELMQLVQKDSQFSIKLRTKTANIQNLLQYDGMERVQLTFSLNTEYIIQQYQKDSGTLDQMIAAINALIYRGGYKILIAIEPIIKYDGYEAGYRNLIKRLKKEINLSKVSTIKVGTVRYKKGLITFIMKTHPKSGLFAHTQELIEPEKEDKRWRYSKEERIKIYKVIKDELKNVPKLKLGLAGENPDLWDDLGLDKTDIHSDVVCQYGQEENDDGSEKLK